MYSFHKDPQNFKAFLELISDRIGLNAVILEKDYYVTLMLQEIAMLQQKSVPFEIYFKGGTALYKALHKINRFSEDIDLTLKLTEDTPSARKRNLKKATSNFTSLTLDKEAKGNISGSGSRTSVYSYQSVLSLTSLARIGEVKIETTAFTTSEPHSQCTIEPVLFTYANEEERQILSGTYEVEDFSIEVITLQRIFMDKIFAIEDYFDPKKANYIEIGKHLYDLCVLMREDEIQSLLKDDETLSYIVNQKEMEQKKRIGARTVGKSLTSFDYWSALNEDPKIQQGFQDMQDGYIYQEEYKFSYPDVLQQMRVLNDCLYRKNY